MKQTTKPCTFCGRLDFIMYYWDKQWACVEHKHKLNLTRRYIDEAVSEEVQKETLQTSGILQST